ncbi:MAG TPA: DUF2279 domain-containing protein [Usitatibacter sp.]|nr:DUF2279 domain-containing protein [Usitatibacter sp.]
MTDLPSYEQLLAQAGPASAEVRAAERPSSSPPAPLPNLRLRNTAIIGGGALVFGAYGLTSWWDDGFNRKFRARREYDFGRNAIHAGVDKLGHVYSTYVATRAFGPLFEWAGNSPHDARKLAAWTAWGAMSAVEIIDGFSKKYSFSYEDFIANTVGALAGYAMASDPALDDLIDLRLSYRPSPLSEYDPLGDYPGQRFHFVVKAEGVPGLRDTPVLKYLELNLAYRAQGIDTPDEWALHDFAQRRRRVYAGVSLNLAKLLSDAFYGGRKSTTRTQRAAQAILDVVQISPTGLWKRYELDDDPLAR